MGLMEPTQALKVMFLNRFGLLAYSDPIGRLLTCLDLSFLGED